MTQKKPVVQQMAEAHEEAPAPSAADQAKAEKEALREQAAAEGLRVRDSERGFEDVKYHGVTIYRILDSPSHTFSIMRDAEDFVAKMRVAANLSM